MKSIKFCNGCGQTKPISDFYVTKSQKSDGFTSRCKDCCRAAKKNWYHRDIELSRQINRLARREDRKNPDHRAYMQNYLNQRRVKKGVADHETLDYIKIIANDPCVYCGGTSGTVDHIIPIAHGGIHHWTNLAAACLKCNQRKNDRELLEWLDAV